MAYALSNPIRRIGPQGSGNAMWLYVDGDGLTTIDAVDYFLLDVEKLSLNDVIFAVGNGVVGFGSVNAISATSIDVTNFLAASIDSD